MAKESKIKTEDPVEKMLEAFSSQPILNQLIVYVRYRHETQYDDMSTMFSLHSSNICRRLKKTYRKIQEAIGGKDAKS